MHVSMLQASGSRPRPLITQVRTYGVRGCEAQVVALRIVDPDEPQTQLATVRVKPQQVTTFVCASFLACITPAPHSVYTRPTRHL